ncbi:hypothetical protein N8Z75_01840 [Crocinitomicaceae bacterium]|nr:hypothetical protein [Crocinitomicaceae bacterium]
MFRTYPGINVYSDMNIENFISYPTLYSMLSLNPSLKTKSEFILKSKRNECEFLSLAFCGCETQEWINEFERNGGLCFHADTYKEKIAQIVQNHQTIYLNEVENFKWSNILPVKYLPSKGALIADNYILSDENKMKNNALPIIKELGKKQNRVTILTCTNSNTKRVKIEKGGFWQAQKQLRRSISDEIKSNQARINNYKSKENIDVRVQVLPFYKGILHKDHKFDLHDRRLMTRYSVVTVGKGFDLLPLNRKEVNDYKVTVRTLFDKEAYDDIKNFTPTYNQYVKWYKENHNQEIFLPFE